MKRTLLSLCAITTTFASPAWISSDRVERKDSFPSSFAFPSAGKWHLGGNVSHGISNYELRAAYNESSIYEYENPTQTLAYRLAAREFFGYGRLFFVEARQAFNIGFVGSAILFSDIPNRLRRNWAINSDIAFGLPFQISERLHMTLRPVVGYAFNTLRQNGKSNRDDDSAKVDYRLYLHSPFTGLGFGFAATENFSFRSRLAFHFPWAKHHFDGGVYHELNIQRHGMSLTLDTAYRLNKCMQWTMELDHQQFTVYGKGASSANRYDLVHFRQTSLTGGVQFSF